MSDIAWAFITPFMWPFPHILASIRLKGSEPRPILKAKPFLDFFGNLSAFGGSLRSYLIAVFIVYGLYNGESYPAFGLASTLSLSWMLPIVLRNVIGTWLICGFWDWWLYFGPLKNKFFKYKIVQKYPSMAQMRHDIFYTSLSSVCASVIEIILCHLYATGTFSVARLTSESPISHLILALTITHWRIPHFWLIHRVMHPWKTDYFPDVGKFLYRHVHSLHHKSYNTTAFSGTNMHPVESTLYYSAALLCFPLGVLFGPLHPCIGLGCLIDLGMGAWIGHDGFLFPGGGDYFHSLHHQHFDCNYGAPHVPIDKMLGLFAGSKEDLAKIWSKKPAGRNANDTYVQSDSPSDKVE